MTKQPTLATRVQVLEERVTKLTKEWDGRFEKRLEERFRAEGEMMDERFANLHAYIDKRFENLSANMDKRFENLSAYMDKRFDGVHNELKVLREGMKIILAKLA
jgi:septation ring formation regulator EzrA